MRALFFSFELLLPIINKPPIKSITPDFFQYSVDVRDLFTEALDEGFKLYVYYENSISDGWADLFARRIRNYYEIPILQNKAYCDDVFFFLAKSEISSAIRACALVQKQSLMVCTSDLSDQELFDLGFPEFLRLADKNREDIRELTYLVNPSYAPEILSKKEVSRMLGLLEELKAKSAEYFLLFDLEKILHGSVYRNRVLTALGNHIEGELYPPISPIILNCNTNELIWPDYNAKISLTPMHMAMYIFFSTVITSESIPNLIDYQKELAAIRTHLFPLMDSTNAMAAFAGILAGGGANVAPALSVIKSAITKEIGYAARYYIIKGTPGGPFGTYIRQNHPDLISTEHC